MMSTRDKAIRGVSRSSTDVRFSNRGYAYAETGQSGAEIGIVPILTAAQIPDISVVPEGVLIYNSTENCLQISDKKLGIWRCVATGQSKLGMPSDGNFSDGMVSLDPTSTIVDAIDALNEQLLNCCVGMTFASHLGTADGSTDGFLLNPNFYIGRVSSPVSAGTPYFTSGWDDDTNKDLIKNVTLLWQLSPGERISDLQEGQLVLSVFNGSNALIHSETLVLDGTIIDQVSSPDALISVTSLQVVGSKIEGYLSINLPLNSILSGNSGYLRVEVKHEVLSSVYSQVIEFFVDSKGYPVITAQYAQLLSAPLKYLSGLGTATISGSAKPQIALAMTASGVWDSTYRSDLLVVDAESIGIDSFVVHYDSSSIEKEGASPIALPIIYNEDFNFYTTLEISLTGILSPDIDGNYPQIRYTLRDPFTSVDGSVFSFTPSALINTLEGSSNDTTEYFVDEDYRLNNSSSSVFELTAISGSGRDAAIWNSQESLVTASGLQVINHRLIYPQQDFSLFVPSNSIDYSGLPSLYGDLSYIRRFRSPMGLGYTNGILLIQGLSEFDRVNKNILIEIRVVGEHQEGNNIQGPGNIGTGWLSLNDDYNYPTFYGDDGDGCFVSGSQTAPYFEFSLGNFSTVYAANQAIEVRVTFKNPAALSKAITLMQVTNWV